MGHWARVEYKGLGHFLGRAWEVASVTSVLAHVDCVCLGFHVVGEVRRDRGPCRLGHSFGMFLHAEFRVQQSVRLRWVAGSG